MRTPFKGFAARFVDAVAAARKAELALPIYVNVALRDPHRIRSPIRPAGPPIMSSTRHQAVLELYDSLDNALFVPETGRELAMDAISSRCWAQRAGILAVRSGLFE
jgi:hypothetical protein